MRTRVRRGISHFLAILITVAIVGAIGIILGIIFSSTAQQYSQAPANLQVQYAEAKLSGSGANSVIMLRAVVQVTGSGSVKIAQVQIGKVTGTTITSTSTPVTMFSGYPRLKSGQSATIEALFSGSGYSVGSRIVIIISWTDDSGAWHNTVYQTIVQPG